MRPRGAWHSRHEGEIAAERRNPEWNHGAHADRRKYQARRKIANRIQTLIGIPFVAASACKRRSGG